MKVLVMRGTENLEENIRGTYSVKAHRYQPMIDIFGENVFFVSAEEVKKHSLGTRGITTYRISKDLQLSASSDSGLNCDLFLASGFDLASGVPSATELDRLMGFLERTEQKRVIQNLVNSRGATLCEDKRSFVGLYQEGFDVIETTQAETVEHLEELAREGPLVVKNRLGYAGLSTHLVQTPEDAERFRDENLEDFVVQEFVPHVGEIRLLFYGTDMIGSRIIYNRGLPWETPTGESTILPYQPTPSEIEKAADLFQRTGALIGCIDLLKICEDSSKIIEFNGVASGYGIPSGPYNCNREIAERLHRDFSA